MAGNFVSIKVHESLTLAYEGSVRRWFSVGGHVHDDLRFSSTWEFIITDRLSELPQSSDFSYSKEIVHLQRTWLGE